MPIKTRLHGIFRGVQICKNPQWANLLFSCEEEYKGTPLTPEDPNVRSLVKSTELAKFPFVEGSHYLIDAQVSPQQAREGKASDLNWTIKSAKLSHAPSATASASSSS